METFFITVPIFLLILVGYVLRRFKVLSEGNTHILNQFVYRVSLPAAILSAFWGISWAKPEVLQILFFKL